jgi:phosphopantetheinyl transferase
MPLMYSRHIDNEAKLGLWQISEAEEFFHIPELNTPAIKHPLKRKQHWAGRFLLNELEPSISLSEIHVQESGRPFLAGNPYFFSISHDADQVAALVSENAAVGLDIERIKSKIAAIAPKFVREDERRFLSMADLGGTAGITWIWTVKEAVFKWYGRGKVDFKRDIQIQELDNDGKLIQSRIAFQKLPQLSLQSSSVLIHDLWVSWIHHPLLLGE